MNSLEYLDARLHKGKTFIFQNIKNRRDYHEENFNNFTFNRSSYNDCGNNRKG